MNYFKVKKNSRTEQVEKVCSLFIKKCREQERTLYVISYKFLKGDKVWFKGFVCCPNQLLQTAYWCESVLPNKSWILDFTESTFVPLLKGGIKIELNPITKFDVHQIFSPPEFLTTAYYDEI